MVVIPKSSFKRFLPERGHETVFRATAAGDSSVYLGDPAEGAVAECTPLAHVSMRDGDSVLIAAAGGVYYAIGKI